MRLKNASSHSHVYVFFCGHRVEICFEGQLEYKVFVQKINKHATAVLGSNWTPWYLSQRNETLHSHKSLSTNVHSSFIRGRWQLEPAQIFFSRWMVKQTTLYPWNRVHHSNKKKKLILDTCNDLDESPKSYIEWKKPIAKVTCCIMPFI